jgi:hypothetical protein
MMKPFTLVAVAGAALTTVSLVASAVSSHIELKGRARFVASEITKSPQAFLATFPNGTKVAILDRQDSFWSGETITVLRKRPRTASADNTGDCIVVVKNFRDQVRAPVACP